MQGEALNILKTGANAFLTGEPGAGKTHTVNTYISWLRSHAIEPSICASTGIAATHVGGMTIHAWSGLGIREYLTASDLDAISSKEHVVRRISKASVLIIDEVSMLSGEVLTMVDDILKEVRRNTRPFGGLQVVLVGDFFQLPPVSKGGREVSFAFESPAWKALNPIPLYLHEQYRQDDRKLETVLGNIRRGACDQDDVSCIMARETDFEGVPEDVPRLHTHNADVDRINAEKLASLKHPVKVFIMEASGAPLMIESLKRGCLSPEKLELKEGAVVMFTKNNLAGGFSNGTLGTVVGFERGTGLPVVQARGGRKIVANTSEWVVEEAGKIRARVAQIPLRLAWAITIHKSQGQSLDAAAIDLSRAFEYGQGYVALSRLRTFDGLHLLGWNENALAIHPSVAARDKQFRDASDEAVRIFEALEDDGERRELEKNFIQASGGSLETVSVGPSKKIGTHDATLELLESGMTFKEIAKKRGLTLGTIADHIERLVASDRFSREKVHGLVEKELLDALPSIFEAFEKVGIERLAPVFSHLKQKYSFDELKIARALYQGE